MFRIDDYDVIDATVMGNAARFINHCCEVSGESIIYFFNSHIYFEHASYTDVRFPFSDQSMHFCFVSAKLLLQGSEYRGRKTHYHICYESVSYVIF